MENCNATHLCDTRCSFGNYPINCPESDGCCSVYHDADGHAYSQESEASADGNHLEACCQRCFGVSVDQCNVCPTRSILSTTNAATQSNDDVSMTNKDNIDQASMQQVPAVDNTIPFIFLGVAIGALLILWIVTCICFQKRLSALENGGGRSENGSELRTQPAGSSQYDAAPSGLFDSVRDDPAVSNYGPAPSAVNEEILYDAPGDAFVA
eukprot:CAMPEP_0168593642 /NCGR_PEP_ID=MMETSP0420-20121227/8431_1 /TAXON_ID=498008 /ORGANISM="Pessonella sp." /LENGTH=209 /DNA_ID=CAMNT_0008629823 /DNA_START=539 /DNA_END=1168 /DNA_ORIENTATION=+